MAVSVRDGSITSAIHDGSLDAFGSVRTSSFEPMAGWTFAYNINPSLVTTDTDGVTGGVTHADNFAVLSTGTAVDGYAQIQTVKSTRYIPGIGGLVRFTARFDTPKADSQQLVGSFDSLDGWAFGYDGLSFGIMRRSGGVDTWTYQDFWNGNHFSDIDPTKGNVYQIEYQWLGYGAQIFAIEGDKGVYETCHTIFYAGENEPTSIDNPNLPITARVENTGNATDIVLRTPSAISGLDGHAYNDANSTVLSADTVQSIASGEGQPILTIKNPTTYESKSNRLFIQAQQLSFAAEGAKPLVFRLYSNATVTGGTYAAIDATRSPIEVNDTFTSIAGGTEVGAYALGKTDTAVIDLHEFGSKVYSGEELTIMADTTSTSDIVAAVVFRQYL